MQDQYAADVGDFGKFGLLRHLLAGGDVAKRLGVVWYYFKPTGKASNDGKHITYHTADPSLCACDEVLAQRLKSVLDDRRVSVIERAEVLPASTAYFGRDLNFGSVHPSQSNHDKNARLRLRAQWMADALREAQGCDLLFLDPDNGLEVPSCASKSQMRAGKYAYLDEIRAFKEKAAIVVVYHHLGRTGSHSEQIANGLKMLTKALRGNASLFALRFHRYSPRAYFVACSPEREAALRASLDAFMASRWHEHWDNYIAPKPRAAIEGNLRGTQDVGRAIKRADPVSSIVYHASDAVIWAIAQNATRHLIEADEHFKKQRYASALASAVLCIEELGKLHFLALTGRTLKREKHRGHQIPFIAMLAVVSGLPQMAPWQTMLKEGLRGDAVLSPEQQKDVDEHPDFAELVRRLRAGELTDPQERVNALAQATVAKEQRDGTSDSWRPLLEGRLHKLRMQATYVDVAKTGDVVTSSPATVDANAAEGLCIGALCLVTLTFTFTMREPLSSHFEDFTKSLPADITGHKEVSALGQAIKEWLEKAKERGELT